MSSISANGPICESCVKHEIKCYPTRQASYSIAIMDKIKTMALLYTIFCIMQQLTEHVGVSYSECKQWFISMEGMHIPRIEFSAKQAAIMIVLTIIVTTMGTAHESVLVHHRGNNTNRSSVIQHDGCRVKRSPLDADGIAHRDRMKRELALVSQQGMAGQCYIDSGCSTTIINRRSILQNIRPLVHPVTIKGLAGNIQIKYQADLRLPVQSSDGRPDMLEIQDVYYQPTSAYNLISCSQLEDAGYDVMFRQRQIMGQIQEIGLKRTGNIYAIQEADNDTKGYIFHQDTAYAGTHVGKMRADELWHRRLMHMSYGKLKRASTMNLPGMPSFKVHDYPCHTCMDANAKRANRKPVSGRDTCDAQFDLFDMSKCESIGGHRYCTVIVMRKSRFVFIFLHKTKDEIQAVWTKCINTLGPKHTLKTVRCDGAGEYISQKFRTWMLEKHGITMQFSSPHEQNQNGLAEKTIDLLTRRMRAGLTHSGLPTSFWSTTLIMTADTMNVTPHKSLGYDTPYHVHYGYHADMRQFRPLGCRCTVFRTKEILTSKN